ncbi:OmpW family outer membrane protein [Burkholderia sp. Ac-20353]|uniref:OmpW/AlkL family protein n=1 Tax=Burkholderia sp. Ac-20353 TaxID=2703894 RepID=UPI00197C5613|nr:OmpW family outer membrane protein [Burkholderia sp. Ac-20353]MBN3788566.1 OmpW family protein [Burkholderia sp. Ac-20353]
MRIASPISFLAAVTLVSSTSAMAQTSPWTVRAGPVGAFFNSHTHATLAGQQAPGADIGVQNNGSFGIEIGYSITPDWTARFAFGVPPTTRLSAEGSLRNFVPPLTGNLGKVTYAPALLTLTYGLGNWGPFRPYVGAGVNYTWVIKTSDGDVSGLKVHSAWGAVLEAGFDVPINKRWSVFADVRKVFLKTSASGSVAALGGAPTHADIRLDPIIAHVGVSYRF